MRFRDFLDDFLDLATRDENGNIQLSGKAGVTIAAPNTLDVEELAIFSVIDLIASAASLCEFRTYQNDTRTRAKDWYAWNVEPNQNQNGTEFKRLLFARLLRYNEALVFQRRDGSLYLADTFARNAYAFRPCTYTGVSTNGLTLGYTLLEDQVYYFRLANQDAAALLGRLRGLYSKAMAEAFGKYQKSGGRSGILHINGTARGTKTFETDIDTLMNDRFKKFFESKNAVLPLFDGYTYTPQDGPAVQKGTSEVSDLDSLMKQAQDRACNAYHVPPSLLRGDVTNMDEAVKSLLTFGLKPPVEVVQTEINRKAYGAAMLQGWRLNIDTTHVRAVDVFDIAEKADKLRQDGIYNVNELREKVGDDRIPEPWADKYSITKNMESVNATDPTT